MTVVGSCPAEAQKARVAVLIGVIAFVVGAVFGLDAVHFVAKTVPTTGVIVARGGSTYTVQFEVEGQPVRFESDMPTTRGGARNRIQVGKQVEVRYDPGAPGDARVGGAKLWTFPLAMMFIGILPIVAGLVKLRR